MADAKVVKCFNQTDFASIDNDARAIPTQLGNALRAAKETGVPRLVFTTSGSTMDNPLPVAMAEPYRAAERAVLSSGVPSVVLAPEDLSRKFAAFLARRNERTGHFGLPAALTGTKDFVDGAG